MRFTYFLLAENKTRKDLAELDEQLEGLSGGGRTVHPSAIASLGGQVKRGGRKR